MIENNKRVPKLRFPGFTDDWEQRKLGDVVEVCSGRDYKHLSEGDIPVYGTGGYMLSVNEALSENGDAVGIGRKGTIDKPYLLRAPFWTVDTLFYAVPREKNDLNYMHVIFQRINWKQKDESTGVPSLSKTTINVTKICIAKTDEQMKIGKLFYKLDNLITLHQRKLSDVRKLKAGLLQKMFPKNGEDVPEIRFPGFTDAWEQRKLRDESKISAGGDIDRVKLQDEGKYPVLANALTNDGIVGYYDNEYRINAPAVTVTGRGDVGYAKARKTCFTPVVRLLSVESNHDVDFLENAINNHDVFVESTGVPQLTAPQLGDYVISFPKYKEEIEIGKFFHQLDNLITLHQRKLEHLQKQKKSLLQQMFI